MVTGHFANVLFANAVSRFVNEPGQTNCCLTIDETTVNCLVSDPYKVQHRKCGLELYD